MARKNGIILLDGAAGTALWDMAEQAGVKKEPVWKYNIEHPEFVAELHRRYIDAGCDMIQTNTFSANGPAVAHSSDYSVAQVVGAAAALCKKAVEGTGVRPYLSFGPPTSLLRPYGTLTKEELDAMFTEMVGAGVEAGIGFVALETFMDLEMMRVAATAAKRFPVTVTCSMTFGKRRRTMMGDTVQKIVDTLVPLGIDGIGLNCGFGPRESMEILREFADKTGLPLYFKPNAGVGEKYDAVSFAAEMEEALPLVHFVGGCCGCDDRYIRELGARLE